MQINMKDSVSNITFKHKYRSRNNTFIAVLHFSLSCNYILIR